MIELRGLIIHADKNWMITETKSGFHLYRKEDEDKVELEDSMSKESFLSLWLRDIQGGEKFDGRL